MGLTPIQDDHGAGRQDSAEVQEVAVGPEWMGISGVVPGTLGSVEEKDGVLGKVLRQEGAPLDQWMHGYLPRVWEVVGHGSIPTHPCPPHGLFTAP
jgi:hypothetical protein